MADDQPVLDVSGGAAEGVRCRDALPAGIGDAQLLAELEQRLFFHKDVGKREIQELAQHMCLLPIGRADDIFEIGNVVHNVLLFVVIRPCG